MRSSILVAAAAASPALASYGSLNLYWGQYGSPADRLSTYCDSAGVDYVTLSFVNTSPPNGNGYPGTNFAGHCGGEVFYTNPDNGEPTKLIMNCDYMKQDIKYCQEKGTKVLLAIGGWCPEGGPCSYDISTEKEGKEFAKLMWKTFGPYDPMWNGPRPFDISETEHNCVDGFDFDLEFKYPNQKPWIKMVEELRTFFPPKKFLITAAPQCPNWDPYFQLKDLIMAAEFDALFIQFYNNPDCQVTSKDMNYDSWEEILGQTSKSKNAKLYIGMLTSPEAGWNGYAPPQTAKDLVCRFKDRPHFGGLSLWDGYRSLNNTINGKPFHEHAVDALMYGCNPIPPPVSTTKTTSTTRSTTSSSTKSSTTSTTTTTTSSSTTSTTSSTSSAVSSTTTTSSSTSSTVSSTTTTSPSTSSAVSSTATSSSTSSVASSTESSTTSSPTSTSTSSAESSTITSMTSSSSTTSSAATSSSTASWCDDDDDEDETSTSSLPTLTSTVSATSTGTSSAVVTSTSTTASGSSTASETSTASSTGASSSTTSSAPTGGETSTVSSSSSTATSVATTSTGEPTGATTTSTGEPTGVTTTSTGEPTGVTTTTSVELTTSTVYTTTTRTVTSCKPDVPCTRGQVTTETIPWYTTICPVTHTPTPTPEYTTSTVYTTKTYTVTSCAATVPYCPVGHVTTEVVPWYTTVCPYTKTTEAPKPTSKPPTPGGGGGESCPGGKNCPGEQTTTTKRTSFVYTTITIPNPTIKQNSTMPGTGYTKPTPSTSSPAVCVGAGCPGANTPVPVPSKPVTAGAAQLSAVSFAGVVAIAAALFL